MIRKMFKAVLISCFLTLLFACSILEVRGYETAKVIAIQQEETLTQDEETYYIQSLLVETQDGIQRTIIHGSDFQPVTAAQRLQVGQEIVVTAVLSQASAEPQYQISDRYRVPTLLWLGIGFFILVSIVAGKKGVFSVIGMIISLLILVKLLVPNILAGTNPLLVSIGTAVLIAGITVYLSHGFSLKSHISLFSMITTLTLVTFLAQMAVSMAYLLGFGSEEATFLQIGAAGSINLQGLLLGGIMLGALGILDDICMSQVSTVFELAKANKELSFYELYQSGMNVGKDHVASLVNTLVLAYAGTNLPLFILFSTSNEVPLWARFNSEFIAEEVVRTLVGSIGLVLAVPLTTMIAAYWARKRLSINK